MSQSDSDVLPHRSEAQHFPWLDPLRFFAAVSVLLFHLHDIVKLPLPDSGPLLWFRGGFLGVDLFFAISGAVIALSLHRLMQQEPTRWRRSFAIRRVARLVPLYLLTCGVFLICVRPEILARQDAAFVVATHALFVHNLFPSTHGVINGPSWSLGVEMQFYLLMLLAGPWLLRRRWGTVLLVLAAVALSWRAGVWLWAQRSPEWVLPRMFIYITQLPGVMDGFGAGILALGWRMRHSAITAARCFPWLALGALATWALVFWLLLRYAAHYWSAASMLLGLRALIAAAAGLAVAAALAAPDAWSPGRFGRLLGDMSYGVYLWHMPVMLWWQARLPTMDPVPLTVLIITTTVLLALASWKLLERPILRWARRF